MTSSQRLQGTPTPQPIVTPIQYTTTFKFFKALPSELQFHIIKKAWYDAIHSSPRHLHATSTFQDADTTNINATKPRILSSHYTVLDANTQVLNLNLVNKLFHTECKFLAHPCLIHLPVSPSPSPTPSQPARTKPTLFIPETDTLHIHIEDTIPRTNTILSVFSSLPRPLRAVVRHITLDFTDMISTFYLLHRLKVSGSLKEFVSRLEAECLESVTVEVYTCWTFFRGHAGFAALERGLQSSRCEGGVVVRVVEVD